MAASVRVPLLESFACYGGCPVFLAFTAGWRVAVRLTGTGRFFCLHCEEERSYQRREWRSTDSLLFIPVSSSGGEFIRCDVCANAFDLECLDESSTASCNELLADAPDAAIRARLSMTQGDATRAVGTLYAEPEWERGSRNVKSLSARSASRKH